MFTFTWIRLPLFTLNLAFVPFHLNIVITSVLPLSLFPLFFALSRTPSSCIFISLCVVFNGDKTSFLTSTAQKSLFLPSLIPSIHLHVHLSNQFTCLSLLTNPSQVNRLFSIHRAIEMNQSDSLWFFNLISAKLGEIIPPLCTGCSSNWFTFLHPATRITNSKRGREAEGWKSSKKCLPSRLICFSSFFTFFTPPLSHLVALWGVICFSFSRTHRVNVAFFSKILYLLFRSGKW